MDHKNRDDFGFNEELQQVYEKSECEQLKLSSAVPARTLIWIARYSGRLLQAGDSNFEIQIKGTDIAKGCAVNIPWRVWSFKS
jgi:hypothetical protein